MPHCGACQREQHQGVAPQAAGQFGVQSIPAVFAVLDGEIVDSLRVLEITVDDDVNPAAADEFDSFLNILFFYCLFCSLNGNAKIL